MSIKIGKKVLSSKDGFGKITEITNDRFAVLFEELKIKVWFYLDGRENEGDDLPTIIWIEPDRRGGRMLRFLLAPFIDIPELLIARKKLNKKAEKEEIDGFISSINHIDNSFILEGYLETILDSRKMLKDKCRDLYFVTFMLFISLFANLAFFKHLYLLSKDSILIKVFFVLLAYSLVTISSSLLVVTSRFLNVSMVHFADRELKQEDQTEYVKDLKTKIGLNVIENIKMSNDISVVNRLTSLLFFLFMGIIVDIIALIFTTI